MIAGLSRASDMVYRSRLVGGRVAGWSGGRVVGWSGGRVVDGGGGGDGDGNGDGGSTDDTYMDTHARARAHTRMFKYRWRDTEWDQRTRQWPTAGECGSASVLGCGRALEPTSEEGSRQKIPIFHPRIKIIIDE
jgi:hypothetical protein